jgi:hypothetical protein
MEVSSALCARIKIPSRTAKSVRDCKIPSRTEGAELEGAEPLAHEAQGFFPFFG